MAKDGTRQMSPRQCEIAAESYAASVLARAGYDVLVQYGANQPEYDLVADKNGRFLPISVKGSQDGGWMLAVGHKSVDVSYLEAIDKWLSLQRKDIVYFLVQFQGVNISEAPRVYVALPEEIALYMKSQRSGAGYGSLQEDKRRDSPKSKYGHKIPEVWRFSRERVDSIHAQQGVARA